MVEKRKKIDLKENYKGLNQNLIEKNPILRFSIKCLILIVTISAIIIYFDINGYFNPDETNNHTKRKWDSFYDFTLDNNIDILLLGNSHLYTGINPKTLSASLGVNSFILAAPGTKIIDSYFCLKEALKKTKPKLVIIETYGINSFSPYDFKEGNLSDQLKSFSARKDFLSKMYSMPYIFSINNYFYAWSNTLRNHRYLFSNHKQLLKNLNYRKTQKKKGLYLGRYVRFRKGLEKETIIKYDKHGSPVNGKDYNLNNYSSFYTKKIVDLCEENNIELIFLTLPMYYKHIENYALWENRLGELLNKFSNPWLNMQSPYDSLRFTAACFENTYNENQHMTYNGSLIATYKLSRFIKDQINLNLPNRKSERSWLKNFYAQESYFENNLIHPKDKINEVLIKNLSTNDILINEISLIKQKKAINKLMLAKIAKNKIDLSGCILELTVKTIINEKQQKSKIKLFYDAIHEGLDFYVFKRLVKPVDIVDVLSGKLICN